MVQLTSDCFLVTGRNQLFCTCIFVLAFLPSAFISLPKIREGGPPLDLPLGYKHTSFTSSTFLFQLEDHVSEEDISLPMDKLDHRELMVSCVG